MNHRPGKLTLEYALLVGIGAAEQIARGLEFLADHLVVFAEAGELGHDCVGPVRLLDDRRELGLVGEVFGGGSKGSGLDSDSASAARALRALRTACSISSTSD
jgi:hypothetical protein